jgi:hypothetical protein
VGAWGAVALLAIKRHFPAKSIPNGVGTVAAVGFTDNGVDLAVDQAVGRGGEPPAPDVDDLSLPALYASLGFGQLHEDCEELQSGLGKEEEIGRGEEVAFGETGLICKELTKYIFFLCFFLF